MANKFYLIMQLTDNNGTIWQVNKEADPEICIRMQGDNYDIALLSAEEELKTQAREVMAKYNAEKKVSEKNPDMKEVEKDLSESSKKKVGDDKTLGESQPG